FAAIARQVIDIGPGEQPAIAILHDIFGGVAVPQKRRGIGHGIGRCGQYPGFQRLGLVACSQALGSTVTLSLSPGTSTRRCCESYKRTRRGREVIAQGLYSSCGIAVKSLGWNSSRGMI